MPRLPDAFIAGLKYILPATDVLAEVDLLGLSPGWHPENFAAGLAVRPRRTAEISQLLKLCSQHRVPVVTQGGRTGLVDGCVSREGELILMTERLDRILAVDVPSMTATVEAGVTLEKLQAACRPHGLTPGVDLGARGSCTIGGMISTNAGGIEAFRNGVMRQRVLGLEAVLADGRVLSDLTEVGKATTGIDVKQLFIGSEGTLGVITKAVLRLSPLPVVRETALVACPTAASALQLAQALLTGGAATLLAAEVMWQDYFAATLGSIGPQRLADYSAAPLTVLIEVTGANEAVAREALETVIGRSLEAGEAIDAVIAKSESERRELWRLREDVFIAEQGWPDVAWFDVSVPLGRLDAYVDAVFQRLAAAMPDGKAFAVAHLADGNVHITVASRVPLAGRERELEDAVYQDLGSFGGAFSAEHGIGLAKRSALRRLGDPVKLAMMAELKRAIDPCGILNPGKVVETNGVYELHVPNGSRQA